MKYRFLRFPGGKFKAATFSYDDGLRADERLAKKFSEYGFKATFNINSGRIGTVDGEGNITVNEMREFIIGLGHEVAVHGHYHRAPGLITPIECTEEVFECRRILERELDTVIRGMAYPDSGIRCIFPGTSREAIYSVLRAAGIAYSRTTLLDDSFALPEDWYDWKASARNTDPAVLDVVDRFLALDEKALYNGLRWPKLFFMWGHSFEFERMNNWELIDEIGARFAKHDDVWYATNMEIYEYVNAYNSLVFSAAGDKVYNPTLIKVWFVYDNIPCSVEPGETLRLF